MEEKKEQRATKHKVTPAPVGNKQQGKPDETKAAAHALGLYDRAISLVNLSLLS